MKRKILISIFFIFLFFNLSFSQNPEWINFTAGNYVQALAMEGDYIWVGTYLGGLVKLNLLTGEKVNYNRANSGLPDNSISAIAIDGQGNKWIGTYGGGLAKFDGLNWTVYNKSNSGLPENWVYALAIDGQGNKWIGTNEGGLAKFDGLNWTMYKTSNSGLPNNSVYAIAIDGQGNKWIGTYSGLAKFDGVNWTVYNSSNSGLPNNAVSEIAIDGQGNKWIGTVWGGLAKFDEVNWTVYRTSNSGLPSNYVRAIAIDGQGNKWIGTWGGLSVYREGGVVLDVHEKIIPKEFSLYQNYPNPFNPSTFISFDLPERAKVRISVYDVIGRLINVLVDEEMSEGRYKVEFRGEGLPSGVYFYRLEANDFVSVKKMMLVK